MLEKPRDSRGTLEGSSVDASFNLELYPLVEWSQRAHKFFDAASRFGPWTAPVLHLLAQNPGVRAGDLAPMVAQEIAAFKLNVRKLKTLGLTESLEVGYRLSPRGAALLDELRRRG